MVLDLMLGLWREWSKEKITISITFHSHYRHHYYKYTYLKKEVQPKGSDNKLAEI